jgi:hypothetical protein
MKAIKPCEKCGKKFNYVHKKDYFCEKCLEELLLSVKKNIEFRKLEHFKATVVGLWATDKPDRLTAEEKKRCCLFQIEDY